MVIALNGNLFDTRDIYMLGPVERVGDGYGFTIHFYNNKELKIHDWYDLFDEFRVDGIINTTAYISYMHSRSEEQQLAHKNAKLAICKENIDGAHAFIAQHKAKDQVDVPTFAFEPSYRTTK